MTNSHITPKTILLVEDESIIALAEAMTLKKCGYIVITAATGEKAVEIVAENSDISLVLMDINLGAGIDGTEAAQLILKKRDIPILFLSSHTEREVVEKTENITSYGYIVKNSGETVLLTSIKMAYKLHEAAVRITAHKSELAIVNEKLQSTIKELQKKNEELTSYQKTLLDQENALKESETRFRSIVEAAPNPIFIQTDRKFAYVNPAALRLFGATDPAQLLGTPVMDRFHPDFHEAVRERIRRLNEKRQPVTQLFEQKYLRLDGSDVWVETVGHPIEFKGKTGALVFVRDISERKTQEAPRPPDMSHE